MTCCLVLLNQAFAGNGINFRDGDFVGFRGGGWIGGVNGGDDLLDCRSHARFQCDVMLTADFRLFGTLRC